LVTKRRVENDKVDGGEDSQYGGAMTSFVGNPPRKKGIDSTKQGGTKVKGKKLGPKKKGNMERSKQ